MPPSDPEPEQPQRPQPGQRRAYQPPPGAAKPQAPPPGAAAGPGPARAPAPMQGGDAPMAGGPGRRPPMPAGAAAAAAAMAGRAPAVGLRGATFEYSFEQDALIKDLAKNIRTVSWVLLALALVLVVRNAKPVLDALTTRSWSSLLDPVIALLGAGVLIYSFIGLRQAGTNFALIPESQGQDQQLTVQAMRGLNKLFNILSLVVIVIGALVALSFVIGALSTVGGKPSKKKDVPKAKTAAVRVEIDPGLARYVPRAVAIDRAMG